MSAGPAAAGTSTRPRLGGIRAAWRVLTVGGAISFRGLFNWLNPYIYIPTLLIGPLFQILLFAYIGRSAGVGSDSFYLLGNAVQNAAIPCLFAMGNTVAGERWTQTLGIVLSTPANRVALFLGRALPVVANGWFVAMFSLFAGARVLGVSLPASTWPGLALSVAIASASCTGLGLLQAALALRVRSTAVLSNILFGLLLVFTGTNVPLDAMPGWMAAAGRFMPLTHAIEAGRELVAVFCKNWDRREPQRGRSGRPRTTAPARTIAKPTSWAGRNDSPSTSTPSSTATTGMR
jgi:ABC-2 type transport system permease protein